MKKLLFFLFLICGCALAQPNGGGAGPSPAPSLMFVAAAPTAPSCAPAAPLRYVTAGANRGKLYGCSSGGTWYVLASGAASAAFSALTSGTNTVAAMVVGTGASLATTGAGTIAATSVGTASSTQICVGPTCVGSDQFTWTLATSRFEVSNPASIASFFIVADPDIGGNQLLGVQQQNPTTNASANGRNAPYIEMDAPNGGFTTIATTGTGGNAGDVVFSMGAGGQADSAAVASTGGNAGGFYVFASNGGSAAVTNSANTGGSGSNFTFAPGSGGGATGAGTAVNVGGNGGSILFTVGARGAASGGAMNTNGASGNFKITLQNLTDSKFGVNVGGADLFTVSNTGIATAPNFVSVGTTFSGLGTPTDGTMYYCSDCKPTTVVSSVATNPVCAGSGNGALAVRIGAAWECQVFKP